jgi:hypothetical protein
MSAVYALIITLHSLLRWVAILLGLMATARGLFALLGLRPWSDSDERFGRLFAVSLDIQLLLGLLLYLFVSPLTTGAFGNMAGAMQNSAVRFWIVEHPFIMILALALAHIGVARVRRAGDGRQKQLRTALFFGLATIFVLVGTPWPFMANGRSLFRLG